MPLQWGMARNYYQFDLHALDTLIGGKSVLEIPHISVRNRDEAKDFILAYGFNLDSEEDLQKVWAYHRKAITYIQDELMQDNQIPSQLTDPKELGDICNLLIMASTRGNELQPWACGVLKVMHVYVHLENDLFAQYSNEIQDQILKPVQAHIHNDPLLGTTLGAPLADKTIILKKFEVKTFKTSTSSVTKLLAKRELNAFSLLDKVGVRIVAKHLFDVFRVLKYFLDNNIISYAHNITDQSNNTLYPLNLLHETLDGVAADKPLASEAIDELLKQRLTGNKDRARFLEKYNTFTSQDYRFIKFITRRLIRLELKGEGGKPHLLSFFYPYEVQIVDYETHLKNMTGAASHEQYKVRQMVSARARLFGDKFK